MSKIKIEILILVSVMVIFQACEYEPLEEYQRHTNKNIAPPAVQIVELNIDSDTIYLYSDMTVKFRFVSSPQEIKAITFYIDSVEQLTVYSDSGIFELNYSELEAGIHTLLVEIYTDTGTGSIADYIGVEAFIFSNTWTIIVNKSFKRKIEATIYNGLLKMTWTNCLALNFNEYILYKCDELNNQIELRRLTATEFIDSSYVGEGGGYIVKVNLQDGKILEWGDVELTPCIPEILYNISEMNEYSICWQKSKFYNAVDAYEVSQYIYYGSAYDKFESTHGPADTVVNIDNAFFGDGVSIILKVKPKNNNPHYKPQYYYQFKSKLSFMAGYSFLCNNENIDYAIYQVKDNEFIYVSNQDSLMRYSVSKKQINGRLKYTATWPCASGFDKLRASPSGKYLTAYVSCDEDVMWINSDDLGNYSVRNLKYLTNVYYFPEIPISDNGIGLINNSRGGTFIYDFNNDSSLAKYNGGSGFQISSNGDYIFLKDDSLRLVQFKDLTFTNIWSESLSVTNLFYEFDALDTNHVVYCDGSAFSVRQCDNFSIIYEFSLSDDNVIDVNYYNQEILTYSEGHLYIRSLSDGSLLKDIPVHFEPTSAGESCLLLNNAIVSSKGLIYFLN